MQESYRFRVTGRVQGVGFRVSAQRQAQLLGLAGWVRNCGDGSVEGVASGSLPADLEAFRKWLHRGPPGARVDSVGWHAVADEASAGRFELRR